jgi:hypothetical protein
MQSTSESDDAKSEDRNILARRLGLADDIGTAHKHSCHIWIMFHCSAQLAKLRLDRLHYANAYSISGLDIGFHRHGVPSCVHH